jgi:hypothetical protein
MDLCGGPGAANNAGWSYCRTCEKENVKPPKWCAMNYHATNIFGEIVRIGHKYLLVCSTNNHENSSG